MEDKIKQAFTDASVMKSGATETLFAGRNLPVSFVITFSDVFQMSSVMSIRMP